MESVTAQVSLLVLGQVDIELRFVISYGMHGS